MPNDLSGYRKNKKLFGTGDLLTYDTPGAVSWLIQRWSPGANHAGMVLHLPDYEGEDFRRWTLEATSGGTRLAYLSELLEDLHGDCYWHRLKPEITMMQRIAAGCWALEQQGVVKYDFVGILQWPFRQISADFNKLLCSEYVQFSWAKGMIIQMAADAAAAKPSDLPKMGVTEPPILVAKYIPIIQVPITVEP